MVRIHAEFFLAEAVLSARVVPSRLMRLLLILNLLFSVQRLEHELFPGLAPPFNVRKFMKLQL